MIEDRWTTWTISDRVVLPRVSMRREDAEHVTDVVRWPAKMTVADGHVSKIC